MGRACYAFLPGHKTDAAYGIASARPPRMQEALANNGMPCGLQIKKCALEGPEAPRECDE
jgi:hypothetical protein